MFSFTDRSKLIGAIDYCRHHSIHGRHGQGQSRAQSLLHLGLPVRCLLRLCLLPGPRDQGLDSRASRPHVGGDHSPHFGPMGTNDNLCCRDGSGREGNSQPRHRRGRQAPRLSCLGRSAFLARPLCNVVLKPWFSRAYHESISRVIRASWLYHTAHACNPLQTII